MNNLLTYRLAIINLIGLVFLGYAFHTGWVTTVISGDSTGIIWVVVAFFAAFMFSLTRRALKVSRYLNMLKQPAKFPVFAWRRIDPTKFLEKGAHLDEMPGWIMLIGLLGNVVGIMMSIHSANLAGGADAQQSIGNLLGSMNVAFSATLVSGVLGIWADINRRVLKTATVLMLADLATFRLAI